MRKNTKKMEEMGFKKAEPEECECDFSNGIPIKCEKHDVVKQALKVEQEPTEFTKARRNCIEVMLKKHPRRKTTSEPECNEWITLDVQEIADFILEDCEEIDRLTAENKRLRKYVTDCIFLLTADIISSEYGRVGATDKDTKTMQLCRIMRLKGEQALTGGEK